MECWASIELSGRPTKRDDKNQVMDVIREEWHIIRGGRFLTICVNLLELRANANFSLEVLVRHKMFCLVAIGDENALKLLTNIRKSHLPWNPKTIVCCFECYVSVVSFRRMAFRDVHIGETKIWLSVGLARRVAKPRQWRW